MTASARRTTLTTRPPALRKPDEIAERTSGLTSFEALRTLQSRAFADFQEFMLGLRLGFQGQISTRTAADVASKLVTGIYQPVYGQIDPIRVGQDARAMAVAELYGQILATENVRPGAIERLLREYPSHEFVLDREQVERLFVTVTKPTAEEADLVGLVHSLVERAAGNEEPLVANLCALPTPPRSNAADAVETRRPSCAPATTSESSAGHCVPGAPTQVVSARRAACGD